MTLVILVFPARIKHCQFLVVRAHQVLQATGKIAQVTTIRSSLNILETLNLNGTGGDLPVPKIIQLHVSYAKSIRR